MIRTLQYSLLLPMLFFGLLVSAQEDDPIVFDDESIGDEESNTEGPVFFGELVLIADVNIYNPALILQDDNSFYIGFEFSNGEGAQPDVRYSVQLMEPFKEGEGDVIVDEYVYDEVLSLAANSLTPMNIIYEAPDFLEGEYRIRLISRNESGLILTGAFVGEGVTLSGSGEYVEILPRSCYVNIVNDDGPYSLVQGVDIAVDEDIELVCTVMNRFGETKEGTLQFVAKERSAFGSIVSESEGELLSFAPGTEEEMRLIIPKATEPQAYDTEITLRDGFGNAISNTISVHYVIQGESATVRNVQFDETSYATGDTAVVTLNIAGYADSFYGARAQEADENRGLGEATLEISVTDGGGAACAETTQKTFTESEMIQAEFSLPIIRDCDTPTAAVKVIKDGKVLDEHAFAIDVSGDEKVSTEGGEGEKGGRVTLGYTGIFIGLVLVLLLIMLLFALRKKQTHINENDVENTEQDGSGDGGMTGPTAALLVAGLIFIGGVVTVEAASYSLDNTGQGGHVRGTGYYNDMAGTYDPNQYMYTAMSASSNYCENTWLNLSLRWEINDSTPDNIVASASCSAAPTLSHNRRNCNISSRSASMRVPGTPGTYPVYVKARIGESYGTWWKGVTRWITVRDPQVNGSCGSANGGAYPSAPTGGLCSAGSPSAVSTSDTNSDGVNDTYSWTCLGISGGSNAQCSASVSPSVTITANPTTVNPGESTDLTWTVANANSCTASGHAQYTGSIAPANGTQTILDMQADTTFVLQCENNGITAQDDAFVDVILPPPPTVNLQICDAGPANCQDGTKVVDASDPAAVSWTSTNANSCSAVSGAGFTAGGATSGNDAVTTPAGGVTETFTIACTGDGGTAQDTVYLRARDPGGIVCTDYSVRIGEDANCSATPPDGEPDLTLCVLSADTGQYQVTPFNLTANPTNFTDPIFGNTTYTLTCPSAPPTPITATVFGIPVIYEE